MIVLEYTGNSSIKTYDFIPMVLFLIILIVEAVLVFADKQTSFARREKFIADYYFPIDIVSKLAASAISVAHRAALGMQAAKKLSPILYQSDAFNYNAPES
ncbi:hypothetical protein [Methylobacter sp. YRD-M1]|uniref:hypothetical protein n=1 Tax=Methylobacter sp. YRD-M1 TaxID=2911520 RepID=UPI00227CB8A0|nr:hypothetical protein [Methylobacter sp. YRD-M1]WAK01905.1 hypothetical protein LZ558_19135 [Methylobacter sp. YRD-M1]